MWVFSSCGASVGFHTRYVRELREPPMWDVWPSVGMGVDVITLWDFGSEAVTGTRGAVGA